MERKTLIRTLVYLISDQNADQKTLIRTMYRISFGLICCNILIFSWQIHGEKSFYGQCVPDFHISRSQEPVEDAFIYFVITFHFNLLTPF